MPAPRLLLPAVVAVLAAGCAAPAAIPGLGSGLPGVAHTRLAVWGWKATARGTARTGGARAPVADPDPGWFAAKGVDLDLGSGGGNLHLGAFETTVRGEGPGTSSRTRLVETEAAVGFPVVSPGARGGGVAPAADGFLGVRYQRLATTVDPAGPGAFRGRLSWAEPLVGLRIAVPLGNNLAVDGRVDQGAIHLPSYASRSSRAEAGVSLGLGRGLRAAGGWRWYRSDHNRDGSSGGTEAEVRLRGPFLGVVLDF